MRAFWPLYLMLTTRFLRWRASFALKSAISSDLLSFPLVEVNSLRPWASRSAWLGKPALLPKFSSLAKPSIGWHLHDSRLYLDMEGLLAWTLAIVLVSFISEKLIILVLRSALSYVGRKLPEKARRVMHTAETLEADVEQKSEHPPAITIDDEQCAPQISDFLSETSHSVTITMTVPESVRSTKREVDGMGHPAVITIDGLDKAFGETVLFRNFSAELPLDRPFLVNGASGSGKTTLLRMLAFA